MANNVRPADMERITTPALAEAFIAEQIAATRAQIGDKKVLLALSGGVDSSVVAALLIRAVGQQLTCVHVNHGLLRKGEPEQVIKVFREQLGANLIYVDAVDRFLDKLAGVADPEAKRKIIGKEFIDPVKFLYKDEVRVVGKALGLPDGMVYRQPFPGPGLGVRCVGAITRDRLEAVRESDAILREEFAKAGLEGRIWQYFTIVPDFKSTGITNGLRTYDWPVVIRAINTVDAVTAEVAELDFALVQRIVARITAEVKGVNRVLWDVTPKPSATIEWE